MVDDGAVLLMPRSVAKARLRGLFNEAQIVELTFAVALENFRSKFNVPLQVEAQGFCIVPDRR